ncbi:hypothetical protein CMK14_08390 [Candidatus Poribacteria bacterium]|nr:hypothetical protein [Candidatus Poribacteria bacterium]
MQKSKSDRFTPTQMFCKEVKPQLSSYLDQELPKLEMGAVGCHLRNCSDCAFEMMQMRQVHSVLQRAQPVSASSTFLPRLMQKATALEPHRPIPLFQRGNHFPPTRSDSPTKSGVGRMSKYIRKNQSISRCFGWVEGKANRLLVVGLSIIFAAVLLMVRFYDQPTSMTPVFASRVQSQPSDLGLALSVITSPATYVYINPRQMSTVDSPIQPIQKQILPHPMLFRSKLSDQ